MGATQEVADRLRNDQVVIVSLDAGAQPVAAHVVRVE